MRDDDHFTAGSARWKRDTLHGALTKRDLEALHENMHWLQHVSTGLGFLLNRLRSLRDRAIIGHLSENAATSLKRIRARILTDSGNAELDTESIVPSLQ